MPTVDFTKDELLADMGLLIDERVNAVLDVRLTQERAEILHEVQKMMTDALMNFWESNLKPAFAKIDTDYQAHDRLLAQHSQDIMELRARSV